MSLGTAILWLMLRRGVGVLVGLVASLFAAGCDHGGSSAHDYAKSACDAYQHIGRVQISTTDVQSAAIRDVARSDVRAAAAFPTSGAQTHAVTFQPNSALLDEYRSRRAA
jgi:hypothetical protein